MPGPDHLDVAEVPLRVRELGDAGDTAPAVKWLDDAERAAGLPLVDEAERDRLRRLMEAGGRDPRWRSLAAEASGEVLGYAAVVLPSDSTEVATGDTAIATVPGRDDLPVAVRSALLRSLRELALPEHAAGLRVWMRHVTDAHLRDLDEDGFVVARQLGILGRDLDGDVEVPMLDRVTVRAYRPDEDDAQVVAVLAAAYEGTGDGGWTMERFAERRELPWFRPEDLLVAEAADADRGSDDGRGSPQGADADADADADRGSDDGADAGRILGLHWLKRRGGDVGEVYNLAIHPDGQGRRLGALLLAAGLAHLRSIGCTEVLLWVDRANERAVTLYTGQGFVTRWDDVAVDARTE